MKNDPIRSKEEAHELLGRLEQFYGEPVLPLGNFCHAMELWMDCIVKNDTAPALIQEVINHGQKYFESLKFMRIDIRKSNLLGRLLYAKEPLRTHMCLIHKGHWNGQAMFLRNATSCVTGRGGSESARMMVDIPESTSLRRRQKLKGENSKSKVQRLGKAGLAKLWSPGDVLPFTEALASEAGVSKLEAMNGW